MKIKLILLVLIFPIVSMAQTSNDTNPLPAGVDAVFPGTSMLLKNRTIIFQKVYTSKLQSDELGRKLYTLLSTIRKFRFNDRALTEEDQFIGNLFRYQIDLSRFGNSVFGTPALLSFPLNATVVIFVKDFKYQVTVSEITFPDDRPSVNRERNPNLILEDFITQKRRTKLNSGKSDLKIAQCLDQNFSDLFDFQKTNLLGDF